MWHTGDPDDLDRDDALRVIKWLIGATANRHYEVIDRHVWQTGFVQQHVLSGLARNGTPFALRSAWWHWLTTKDVS